MVRQVGGPRVEVACLIGYNDPHRYTPTAGDLGKLAEAKVVFFNGLHLEGKMTDVLERQNQGGRGRAVAVTAALDPDKELRKGEAGGDGPHDPHVWFDVKLWARCVGPVADTLAEADPAHAAEYRANAARYVDGLARLDAEVREALQAVPKGRRILVTSHDAFGYFAAAYGFEVRGLQGISTAAEISLGDRQALAKFLGEREVPAVFCETSVPSKGLQSVLDVVAQQYRRTVKLVGGSDALYSDALGEPGTPAETYVGMVRHNVGVIVAALK